MIKQLVLAAFTLATIQPAEAMELSPTLKNLKEALFIQDQDNKLFIGVFDGDVDAVRQLLEQGANPNPENSNPYSSERTDLLSIAENRGHIAVRKLLLAHGARHNPPNASYGANGNSGQKEKESSSCSIQ